MPNDTDINVHDRPEPTRHRLLPSQAIEALERFVSDHAPHAVLSFDVFDTLIWRKCARPADVFRLMGAQGFGRGALVAERRLVAELIASKIHKHANVDHIMSFFPLGWTAQDEIEFEASMITPNPALLRWISKASSEIPILYISDMYLSEDIVHEFLVNLGFPAERKNVFTSTTRGCSKREHGELFKLAMQSINRDGLTRHCHIGDHFHADIENAPPNSETLWLHTPSSWLTSTRAAFFDAPLDERTHRAQDALRLLAEETNLPRRHAKS